MGNLVHDLINSACDPMDDAWQPLFITDMYGKECRSNYAISKNGLVMNVKDNKIITGTIDKAGVNCINLLYTASDKTQQLLEAKVHRLVAELFVPNPDPKNKKYIIHLDKNKLNNAADNLIWADKAECMFFSKYGVLKLEDINDDVIHKICRLSETAEYSPKQIAKQVGCPYELIKRVWNKKLKPEISDLYSMKLCHYIHYDRYIDSKGVRHLDTSDGAYNATNGREILISIYNELRISKGRPNSEIAKNVKCPEWLVEKIRLCLIDEPRMSINQLLGGWRTVSLFGKDTTYQVNRYGIIRNTKNDRISMGSIDSKGYNRINMRIDNQLFNAQIHRLVALAFIPNPNNLPEINHIDGNPMHNHVSNLEWVTSKENSQHAIDNGLRVPLYGSDSHCSKHTNEQIHDICKLLSKGISCSEVSNITGVKYDIVKNVHNRVNWKHISSQYKW